VVERRAQFRFVGKSLVTGIGILGDIALGALALPKVKDYAETVYYSFEGATTSDGFVEE